MNDHWIDGEYINATEVALELHMLHIRELEKRLEKALKERDAWGETHQKDVKEIERYKWLFKQSEEDLEAIEKELEEAEEKLYQIKDVLL